MTISSLASQLQQIAAGNPFVANWNSTKRRPSLLFDEREAADVDVDTVYAMASNAMLELVQLDRRFQPFAQQSLFSEPFKYFDRSLKVYNNDNNSIFRIMHISTRHMAILLPNDSYSIRQRKRTLKSIN